MNNSLNFIIRVTTPGDLKYAESITDAINLSAKSRGTGIRNRPYNYIEEKISNGLAVIAIHPDTWEWIGFCCLEVWQHEKFVANTGLIISKLYQGKNIATGIKIKLFDLCRERFPQAKIFSLTANEAVKHLNEALGFKIIPYSDLLNDFLFMQGYHCWVDYIGLMTKGNDHLNYSAMLYIPDDVVAEGIHVQKRKNILTHFGFHQRKRKTVPRIAVLNSKI